MDVALLNKRVVRQLTPLVGETLLGVAYKYLDGEVSADDIFDPEFYFGGEVEMRFTNASPVFISWDENAGWADHFSVMVRTETAFRPGSLISFDASTAVQWKAHVGCTLVACSVLGWDETPHVVAFRFTSGTVLVGDGYQNEGFRDGDDVLVRAEQDARKLPGMTQVETLWHSGNS